MRDVIVCKAARSLRLAADSERVLTIGVHGPAELHILLLDGMSDDLMER